MLASTVQILTFFCIKRRYCLRRIPNCLNLRLIVSWQARNAEYFLCSKLLRPLRVALHWYRSHHRQCRLLMVPANGWRQHQWSNNAIMKLLLTVDWSCCRIYHECLDHCLLLVVLLCKQLTSYQSLLTPMSLN